jgi:hypothetical protein
MKDDAIRGLRHYVDEVLVAEIEVPATKDRFWRQTDTTKPPFSTHIFNMSGEDFVVRIYQKQKSVTLPKKKGGKDAA